jgi:quercetin dioxygenase-like cupin family protein
MNYSGGEQTRNPFGQNRKCEIVALLSDLIILLGLTHFFGLEINNFPPMQRLGSGVITTTRDVDCVEFDWGKIHFLSEPVVTGAERFSFGVVELAQGKGHARHNHPGSEEIIYVVSGEGEQMIDNKPPVKVGPGISIYIPADIYHSTVNTGAETMKLIVVYSPAGPERLLREIPGAKVVPPSS